MDAAGDIPVPGWSVTDVTVIVITRNRPDMLAQAVRSALGQVGGPPPVVVVDDASEPATAALLADRHGQQVTLLRHAQQGGIARARNTGLSAVATRWVGFLDDDDLWAPDKLRSQLGALAAHPASQWCYPGVMWVDAELNPLGVDRPSRTGQVLPALLETNVVLGGGSGVLADTEEVRAAGLFDPTQGAEDWDLWIRLAMRSPVTAVDRPLVAYRWHGGNISGDPRLLYGWRLADKYREARAAHGISGASADIESLLRRYHLEQGHRRAATLGFARAAWQRRSPVLATGAVLTALSPQRMLAAQAHRRQRAIPADWRSEVESWLGTYRHPGDPAGNSAIGAIGSSTGGSAGGSAGGSGGGSARDADAAVPLAVNALH